MFHIRKDLPCRSSILYPVPVSAAYRMEAADRKVCSRLEIPACRIRSPDLCQVCTAVCPDLHILCSPAYPRSLLCISETSIQTKLCIS